MQRSLICGIAVLFFAESPGRGMAPRFEKVSEHCHVLTLPEGARNFCAVITAKGILLVDPPPEPDLGPALDALRRISGAPLLWRLHTDPLRARAATEVARLPEGTVLLASEGQFGQVGAGPETAKPQAADRGPIFTFDHPIALFPEGIEVRVVPVARQARTGGDVVVIIPAERVVLTGDLFRASSFPEIVAGQGSAQGWIEGLKGVIEAVPVLKSAMPQPKPDRTKPPPEEKTLEELITVVPGCGPLSNLMEMKSLLDAAQKVHSEISRAVAAKRTREAALASAGLSAYLDMAGFEAFASLLFDELQASRKK